MCIYILRADGGFFACSRASAREFSADFYEGAAGGGGQFAILMMGGDIRGSLVVVVVEMKRVPEKSRRNLDDTRGKTRMRGCTLGVLLMRVLICFDGSVNRALDYYICCN